ncbi:hypothetical protein [Actinomadura atramentaria]|uniref:hypothetical protein n=1 Tax=Actinomadura atramentaria TaxID=1990 RepID=UPI0003604746|nr:hypothetical protein [Actinomadura atramentaria]
MDGNGRKPGHGDRLGSWRTLVPLCAATVAAFAVAGGLDAVDRHSHARSKERSAAAAAAHEVTEKAAEPRYVVGVRRNGTALVVRDAKTGKDVGLPVAAAPGARFERVARGGGAYVVASSTGRNVTFQKLTLDGKGHPASLTAVPGAAVTGRSTAWSDLAVSQDGRSIAYVTYTGKAGRVDVLSGAERKSWTTKSAARIGSLSFAGRTLSFVWSPVARPGRHQVRTLDTAGESGDLRVSRAVLTLPAGSGPALLSKDGATLIAGVGDDTAWTLRAYSVKTGKPTRDLWTRDVESGLRQLAADSGGHLLAAAADGSLYGSKELSATAADLTDVAW